MRFERRMVTLLILLAVLGAPALGLRLLCVGHACDEPIRSTASIPFCSLDGELRELIANGFREGRSPDVLAVPARPVGGGTYFDKKKPGPEWPSSDAVRSTRVPIAFRTPTLGIRVGDAEETRLPSGTGLDDIAPTIATLTGLDRPHPEVRSGRAVPGVEAADDVRLIVQIVWKGVGSEDLERDDADAWPTARALVDGFGTMDGRAMSLPLDPSAALTTIGTGGVPAQHGITGSLLRNDSGQVREAWSADAPVSVIAGLADDMDELTSQRALVGMVADQPADRGLIGDNWYVDGDKDDFVLANRPFDVVERAQALLKDGYGEDSIPDLLAVALERPIPQMDDITFEIIQAALDKVGEESVLIAFSATGSAAGEGALASGAVTRKVDSTIPGSTEVVSAGAPGGLYLDQDVVAKEALDDDAVLSALENVRDASGTRIFKDVFPAIAVSFGRYC
jgi:hypothetical protein